MADFNLEGIDRTQLVLERGGVPENRGSGRAVPLGVGYGRSCSLEDLLQDGLLDERALRDPLDRAARVSSDPGKKQVEELSRRYGVEVCDIDAMPPWVLANDMPQGAPPPGVTVDLDALLGRLEVQAISSPEG